MNILDACRDPNLFEPHFGDPSWAAWLDGFIPAAFGLPVGNMDLYRACTGRDEVPVNPVREGWMICGRRSGKSHIAALIAVYLAAFHDYSRFLSAGEMGLVSVIASDRKQARVIMRYIKALLTETPMLAALVVKTTRESIELSNQIAIEVNAASISSPRGYTLVAALADEIAFWRREDSANPDTEILSSLRPAMATIPNAMILCLGSPYARRGAQYDTFKRYYGEESPDILVWKAPTWVMNPTVSQSFLSREQERDPIAYQAEYGAEFRSDISGVLDEAWVDSALCLPNLDLPRSVHDWPYFGFCDMSGGRSDSATLAIAHVIPDEPYVHIDCLRRWVPPFGPQQVVEEMAETLEAYELHAVTGDNYSAELTVELFNKAGIDYIRSEDSASDLYLQAIPLFSTGRLQAPDHPVLRAELLGLERRPRVSGKDLVTHPPGGHDDLANACCGAAVNAWRSRYTSEGIVTAIESDASGSVTDIERRARHYDSPWGLT